jgi:mannose-1-phosphate guanylyltransferase
MIPVIISGGTGTRLWPLSRKNKPKQFLSLFGEYSLFQNTLSRLSGLQDIDSPLIVCNTEHRFMVAEQSQEID